MTPGDARQQAADAIRELLDESLRELLDEWESCAEVGWARALSISEARLLLSEYGLLLVRSQEQADEIAKHAKDLEFFSDNTDEYFDKWRDAERRVQEAERAQADMALQTDRLLGVLRGEEKRRVEAERALREIIETPGQQPSKIKGIARAYFGVGGDVQEQETTTDSGDGAAACCGGDL